MPSSTHKKLTDICKTRWVQRLDSLQVFTELLTPVVETLEDIKSNSGGSWNTESITKANGLCHQITEFSFLLTLTVARECLMYTRGVTVKLQKRSLDAKQAYDDVTEIL